MWEIWGNSIELQDRVVCFRTTLSHKFAGSWSDNSTTYILRHMIAELFNAEDCCQRKCRKVAIVVTRFISRSRKNYKRYFESIIIFCFIQHMSLDNLDIESKDEYHIQLFRRSILTVIHVGRSSSNASIKIFVLLLLASTIPNVVFS